MFFPRLFTTVTLVAVVSLAVFWLSPWAGVLATLLIAGLAALATREFFALTTRLGLPGYPRLTMVLGVAQCLALGGVGLVFDLDRAAGPRAGSLREAVAQFERALPPTRIAAQQSLAAWQQIIPVACLLVLVGAAGVFAFRAADRATALKRLLTSIAGFICISGALGFALRLYYLQPGLTAESVRTCRLLVIFPVLVTKAGDIGGYVVGSLTARRAGGNHKLVPSLSPKKSWEGLAGGLVFSLIMTCIIILPAGGRLTLSTAGGAEVALLSLATAMVLAGVMLVLGLAGDLMESLLKRAADVKDSGSGLPGVGGTLDLLDSLLPVLPSFYVYIALVLVLSHG